jgi:hypothetical protein
MMAGLVLSVLLLLSVGCASESASRPSPKASESSSSEPDLPSPAETCKDHLAMNGGDIIDMAQAWEVSIDKSAPAEEIIAALADHYPKKFRVTFSGTPDYSDEIASCERGLLEALGRSD